jgi:hypothetical protein
MIRRNISKRRKESLMRYHQSALAAWLWGIPAFFVMATSAHAAAPLTWADLVDHPERWPAQVKTTVGMKINGQVVKPGTPFIVQNVTANEAELLAPQGFIFGIAEKNCDLVAGANALAATLSDEQKGVTLQAIQKDPSLLPGKVKNLAPLDISGRRYPPGTEMALLNIQGGDVGIWPKGAAKAQLVPVALTDVFTRARELAAMPMDKRPGRIAAALDGAIIDASGKPAQVPVANYYVLYFAASTCPRCEIFTPKIVEHFNKSLAGRKDVVFLVEPTDATTPPMLAYMKQKAIPWPAIPTENKAVIHAFGVENVDGAEIPGILVLDRFGNALLSSKKLPGQPMEAAEAALAKLDSVLTPAPAPAQPATGG